MFLSMKQFLLFLFHIVILYFAVTWLSLSPREVLKIQSAQDEMIPEDHGDTVVNLDFGDPTMYRKFWKQVSNGNEGSIRIYADENLSYLSRKDKICWFMEPKLARAIIALHKLVGNARVEDRHIVVGVGSSQLYLAAINALSADANSKPMRVVAAAPYYSSYPPMTDHTGKCFHKWSGDANTFNESMPYIEIVTSPNNPDGFTRTPVVNRADGELVHDLAYYWPQYTPISSVADHDIMLFTLSKATGHAGMRIGWAIVKDEKVAKKMVYFVELNSIGVSKDSQFRAAILLQHVIDGYDSNGEPKTDQTVFQFGFSHMAERWKKLRAVVQKSPLFSLPDYTPEFCNFTGKTFEPLPAFAWLKCEGKIKDCESFLREHKIITRGGKRFGGSPKFVRISMVDTDHVTGLFIDRLSNIRP